MCYFLTVPSRSDGEATEVAMQSHREGQDIKREVKSRGHFHSWKRYGQKLQAQAEDAEKAKALLMQDEPKDSAPFGICCYLKGTRNVILYFFFLSPTTDDVTNN